MPTKHAASEFFKAKAFTQNLRGLIASLPSEHDKREIAAQIDVVIGFLTELRDRLGDVPSLESTADVRAAIDRLDTLFANAKMSPVVAAAVGVVSRPARPKPQPLGGADIEEAKAILERLESLPIDELRATLDKTPLRVLHAIASALGMRTTQRTTQDVLAHQVATKITNVRGYRSLRDGGTEPPTDKS